MSRLAEAIKQAAPSCKPIYLDAFANDNELRAAGIIGSPLRESHFLGQFLGETGGGSVLQENLTYSTVDRLMKIFGAGHHSAAISQAEAEHIIALPAARRGPVIGERVYGAGNAHKMAELGNRPGDGYAFRGIGPLQSTGRGAAKRWGDKLGIDFQSNVLLMLDPRYVLKPSLFEWDAGKCNVAADRDDGRVIRRFINGGYNGLADCEAWQDKLYKILRDPEKHADEPWKEALASPTTSQLQNSLNLLGFRPVLTLDGRYGPRTKDAVRWFQTVNGLKVDGIAGPATMTVINLRFSTKRGGVALEEATDLAA